MANTYEFSLFWSVRVALCSSLVCLTLSFASSADSFIVQRSVKVKKQFLIGGKISAEERWVEENK